MSYIDRARAINNESKAKPPKVNNVTPIRPRNNTEGLHPYAASAIAGELGRLDECRNLGWNGPAWDHTTFEVACNLLELANSPWSGYSENDARNDFDTHAPSDPKFNPANKWGSATKRVGMQGRPEPSPGEEWAPPAATRLNDEHKGDKAGSGADDATGRKVRVKSLAGITMKATQWVWSGRIALGTLALLAGREGAGKSTLAYQIAADMTNGVLAGDMEGTPQAVIVCATEDSMSQTIVPRLVAAGADLNKILQVDIETEAGVEGLRLPSDIGAVEKIAKEHGVGLMILDPLISRLGDLDTHRDAEVRQALEPLVSMAERAMFAIIGLIHHNKSASGDPLGMVMGSRAFTAVARSVHTVMIDPEDEQQRVFGTVKNNLGDMDLPSLVFGVESKTVGHDAELDLPITSGRIKWLGERDASIARLMEETSGDDDADDRFEIDGWLRGYLTERGSASRPDVLKAAYAQSYTQAQLKSARKRVGIRSTVTGFPAIATWELE